MYKVLMCGEIYDICINIFKKEYVMIFRCCLLYICKLIISYICICNII